jgi:hypothetical protein
MRPQNKIYESVEADGTERRKVISFEVDRSLGMFRLRLGTDVNASEGGGKAMLMRRRPLKQTTSISEKLFASAKAMRDRATRLPSGLERDALLRRARRAETASHLEDWANSAGLQPPE